MFSHTLNDLDNDLKYSTNLEDRISKLVEETEQSQHEYEEAKKILDELNREIAQKDEKLSVMERDDIKLMSELASQMQVKNNVEQKLKDLNNTLQSIEFDLKKYNKMKLSSDDLETFTKIKKIFVTYKNMLKIFFDYSNGLKGAVQKGYMYNRNTRKLAYFEFNQEEKSADKISENLWKKMKLISDYSGNS